MQQQIAHVKHSNTLQPSVSSCAMLIAGEKVDMPVFFYIDPEFATDPRLRGVDHITLSYTFFKVSAGPLLESSC